MPEAASRPIDDTGSDLGPLVDPACTDRTSHPRPAGVARRARPATQTITGTLAHGPRRTDGLITRLPRRGSWQAVAVVVLAALVTLSGCTAAPASTSGGALLPRPALAPAPGPTSLAVRALPGLGPILTTGAGFAVYVFPPDERRIVSCVDACAGSWPPLTVAPGGAPVLGPGIDPRLVGQKANPADPDGPQVLTYDGWPLYTYAADVDPGQASGQGLDLDGGPWYVIAPTGRVVVPPDQLAELGMSGMGGQ